MSHIREFYFALFFSLATAMTLTGRWGVETKTIVAICALEIGLIVALATFAWSRWVPRGELPDLTIPALVLAICIYALNHIVFVSKERWVGYARKFQSREASRRRMLHVAAGTTVLLCVGLIVLLFYASAQTSPAS